jgi:hypothetical protein
MENLLALLLIANLVFLIIGFFSPKTSLFWDKKNEPTRKRSGLIYGSGLLVSSLLLGFVSESKQLTSSVSNESNNSRAANVEVSVPALTQQQLDSVEKENANIVYQERKENTITAPKLTASYEENEVKADENFKGKTFFVEGTILEIKKDIMDEIYVILQGDKMFRNVQCYFDDTSTASQLQKGMRVTFQGTCNGLMMNVLMKNCVLEENLSVLKMKVK